MPWYEGTAVTAEEAAKLDQHAVTIDLRDPNGNQTNGIALLASVLGPVDGPDGVNAGLFQIPRMSRRTTRKVIDSALERTTGTEALTALIANGYYAAAPASDKPKRKGKGSAEADAVRARRMEIKAREDAAKAAKVKAPKAAKAPKAPPAPREPKARAPAKYGTKIQCMATDTERDALLARYPGQTVSNALRALLATLVAA